jgi:hypothetical protein
LCSFVQIPVTSSLFGPNILLSTVFSPSVYIPLLMPVTNIRIDTEPQKICFCTLTSMFIVKDWVHVIEVPPRQRFETTIYPKNAAACVGC